MRTCEICKRQMFSDSCVFCQYWIDLRKHIDLYPDETDRYYITCAGIMYTIEPEWDDRTGRGNEGKTYEVISLDGQKKVITSNLWTVGGVPPHFKDKFPDTHTLKEITEGGGETMGTT